MHQHKILVVEDELPLLHAISSKLEKEGFVVIGTTTANDAWEQLKSNPDVACVWLDHYLPEGKSGFSLLVDMRESELYKHVPVFIVSNTEGSDKIYKYTKLEVDKYFIKSNHKLDQIVKEIHATLDK